MAQQDVLGALGCRFNPPPRIWLCHSCSLGQNYLNLIPGSGTPHAMGKPKKRRKKKCRHYCQTAWLWISTLTLNRCVNVNKTSNFLKPQFPYVQERTHFSPFLMRWLWKLNKIMHVTCLADYQENSHQLICISYYFMIITSTTRTTTTTSTTTTTIGTERTREWEGRGRDETAKFSRS